MSQLKQLDISVVRNENAAFWVAGNKPTQSSYGLDVEEIYLHLKALYLLTDRIVAAASYYFESEITREITAKLKRLFEEGDVVFFVDALVEDFTEHGASKIEHSPKNLISYSNKETVEKRADELNSYGYILKRPSQSISDKIVDIWIRDISSNIPGTLGYALIKLVGIKSNRQELIYKLAEIARNRGPENFVWEYLYPKLRQFNFPNQFIYSCKQRLSSMYAIATSEILEIPIDQNKLAFLSPYITPDSRFDSDLFLSCMEILGVKDLLKRIDIDSLIQLKKSIEFIVFREFYFLLIETVGYKKGEIEEWLLQYRELSQSYSERGMTVEEFLLVFEKLCQSIEKPSKSYKRPLEALLHRYELTNKLSIESFIGKLTSFVENTSTSTQNTFRKIFVLGTTNEMQSGSINSPFVLVMKGGGAKGLAYLGAIKVLDDYYDFNWFVGTSAGAISAVLLASGYTATELEPIFREKSLKEFKDARSYQLPLNYFRHGGFYPALKLNNWLEELLNKKVAPGQGVQVRLEQIDKRHRCTVYAARRGEDALDFDSHNPETRKKSAVLAVRASIAIPYIFFPQTDEEQRVFDGGLRHNYPLPVFLNKYNKDGNLRFLGLYLGSRVFKHRLPSNFIIFDLIEYFLSSNDETALREYSEQTIIIDPTPISTLNFKLGEDEKDFLIASGRAAALDFVARQPNIKSKPSVNEVREANELAETLRAQVQGLYRRRKWRRRIVYLLLIIIALVIYWFFNSN